MIIHTLNMLHKNKYYDLLFCFVFLPTDMGGGDHQLKLIWKKKRRKFNSKINMFHKKLKLLSHINKYPQQQLRGMS